jgi:hypothetical protein
MIDIQIRTIRSNNIRMGAGTNQVPQCAVKVDLSDVWMSCQHLLLGQAKPDTTYPLYILVLQEWFISFNV